MEVEKSEVAKIDSNCEIRIGESSWDKNEKSVKYTWFDKNGKATRGGEFPIDALPQMSRMAIEYGYISPKDFING